jgi:hypothetical protein
MPITVLTNDSTGVEETNATLHGFLQYDGGDSCTVRFEYGTNTSYGTNTTNQTKTGGNSFSAGISSLTKGQLYRYRAYGNNTEDSDLGDDSAFLTKPDPPSSFVATVFDNTRINLTWVVGTGANLTYIERHTTQTWGRGDGTEVYNNSGTSYQDTGLSPGIQYFYRAWSFTTWTYNPTLHQFSDSNASAGTNTTAKNKNIFNMSRGTYSLEMDTNATTLYGYIKSTVITAPIDTEWHHVALTYDGTTARLYKDGASVNSTAIGGSITYPGTIPDLSAGLYLTGYLDELRISSSARNAAWINTSYLNTNSPTTFATFGSHIGVLSTWSYRKKITINSSLTNETLYNFPLLVSNASDTDLQAYALPSGNDIIFLNATASANWEAETWRSKLDHEIEKFDSSTGELVAWVRLPTLSSTVDTEIYMYYGNTVCTSDRQNIEGVWDSNYTLVQHLNETPANDVEGHLDSTSNDNDGTPKNFDGISTSTTDGTGKIDGADVFDGSNDYVPVSHDASLNPNGNDFSVSVWFNNSKTISSSSDINMLLSKGHYQHDPTDTQYFISLRGGSYNGTYFRYRTFSGGVQDLTLSENMSNVVSDDNWHHVVVSIDEGGSPEGSIYLDGVLKGTRETFTLTINPTWDLKIGLHGISGFYYYLEGPLDEVRISNIARNASWINATFNNANDSATYITFGSQEIPNVAPVLSNPTPSDGTTGQSLNPQLSITVADINIDSMNVTFRTNASGSWADIGSNNSVYNGTYSQTPSGMSLGNTKYWWSVNVTDETAWTNETYDFTTQAESQTTVYNFSDTENNKAYHKFWTAIIPNPYSYAGVEYDSGEYEYVSLDDSNRTDWGNANIIQYVYLTYNFTINENPASITEMGFLWKGYDDTNTGGDCGAWVWNFTSGTWLKWASIPDTESSDQTYTKTYSSGFSDLINSTTSKLVLIVRGGYGGEDSLYENYVQVNVTHTSSPFIYTYQDNEYTKLSDFVAGATSIDKEYTQFIDITDKTDVADGKVRLKITEELDETTYLDRLYLRVDDNRIIELDSITTVTKDSSAGVSFYLKTAIEQSFSPEQFILSQINKIPLKQSDNHYLILREGDEYYLEFIAPEGRYSKLEFVAEGYYIEHYKNH